MDPIQVLEDAGQGHLVAHAETLAPDVRKAFLDKAAGRPWQELRDALAAAAHPVGALEPPEALTFDRQAAEPELVAALSEKGHALLAAGRVATLLLAGGQGTRLGYDGPKGNVVFGPEDDRTLYRIHAERVAALSERAGRPIPFYILVSAATERATREAFEHAAAWGLEEGQVRFLVQGTLPCLDDEGRALLAAPGVLAEAPDGHGGAYHTLVEAGVIDALAEGGVDVLTTYQVDNPLGRGLDPVMLGWMVEQGLEAVGKAVRKATPDEKVGVFARDPAGRTRIVEYTELPADDATAASLVMGSIAIHGFSVPWLKSMADAGMRLPLHRARKKVPYLAADGKPVTPDAPNAWKLERFIFDLFPEAARAEVHEVNRAWEFAPVKNAEGVDSLVTARALVEAEVRRWHEAKGLALPASPALAPRTIDGPA